MTNKTLPLRLENPDQRLYAHIGQRLAAGLLDGIFLVPVTVGLLYFNSLHLYNYYLTWMATQLVLAIYCIYLPLRFGATPGKRVMGLTILKMDGAAISYRESILKYLPMLILGVCAFIIQSAAITMADESVFSRLGWVEQNTYLQAVNPVPMWIQMVLIYGYYVVTILMVVLDSRNRSLSDRVAGTVVVRTDCLDRIAEL